jgi:hypothetical protein
MTENLHVHRWHTIPNGERCDDCGIQLANDKPATSEPHKPAPVQGTAWERRVYAGVYSE